MHILHVPPPPPVSIDLLIFLHGVGASGADLAPLAKLWHDHGGFAVATPDGPEPFAMAAVGRQWFSIVGVTDANRGERVAAAAASFDAVIDREIAAAGTTAEHTVLVGFSQGTIMALDALVRGRHFAGVVGYSGLLARAPMAAHPLDGAHVLLVHGDADGVIPEERSVAARHALAEAGARADFARIAGGAHGIGPAASAVGYGFVERLVAGEEA